MRPNTCEIECTCLRSLGQAACQGECTSAPGGWTSAVSGWTQMSATDALDAYLQASGAHARPSARRCSASGGSQSHENRHSAGAVLSGSAAVRKQAGRGSAAPSQRTQPAAADMFTRRAGACVSSAKQRARAAAGRPALAPEQARAAAAPSRAALADVTAAVRSGAHGRATQAVQQQGAPGLGASPAAQALRTPRTLRAAAERAQAGRAGAPAGPDAPAGSSAAAVGSRPACSAAGDRQVPPVGARLGSPGVASQHGMDRAGSPASRQDLAWSPAAPAAAALSHAAHGSAAAGWRSVAARTQPASSVTGRAACGQGAGAWDMLEHRVRPAAAAERANSHALPGPALGGPQAGVKGAGVAHAAAAARQGAPGRAAEPWAALGRAAEPWAAPCPQPRRLAVPTPLRRGAAPIPVRDDVAPAGPPLSAPERRSEAGRLCGGPAALLRYGGSPEAAVPAGGREGKVRACILGPGLTACLLSSRLRGKQQHTRHPLVPPAAHRQRLRASSGPSPSVKPRAAASSARTHAAARHAARSRAVRH